MHVLLEVVAAVAVILLGRDSVAAISLPVATLITAAVPLAITTSVGGLAVTAAVVSLAVTAAVVSLAVTAAVVSLAVTAAVVLLAVTAAVVGAAISLGLSLSGPEGQEAGRQDTRQSHASQ